MRIAPAVVMGLVLSSVTAPARPLDVTPDTQAAPPQTATVPGQPAQPGRATPPRDPTKPGDQQIAGTAILRGQVVAADGSPLRRAQVRAMSQDGRGGGINSTDAQGRFEIKELAAGRYTVSASKAGYVTMGFGQRRPDQAGSGTILDVLDKQLVEKIVLTLPRGGVITGRVVDEFGEPIAAAQVAAMRARYMNGARRMTQSGGDATDDQGTFRIYGLPPGEYIVQGTVRTNTMMMPGMTSGDVEGFAPGYYPGTPSMAEAQRVTLKGGQELASVNFALAATRLARIRGRVTTSTGEPPPGPMMIMVISGDGAGGMTTMTSSAQTRADGTFQLTGLAPAAYTVSARSMSNPAGPAEAGQARITVTTEDLDNVAIVMSRGATARGTISTDDGTPLPLRPQQIRIFASTADPGPVFIGGGTPTVNDDWTFEMTGLFDRRLIRASLAEAGDWFFKSVSYRGQDVTDTPMEFIPGQTIEGLDIVFTKKATEVTGIVQDDRGQPALNSTIVIFSNDSSRWTYASRYNRTARVDQDGRYQIRNMPPHDAYRVVAVTDLEEGRWSDPEFLESVRETAARVTLDEGATKVQDLRVIKAP